MVNGVNPNTTYYLRVRIYNACDTSDYSLPVSVTTLPNPPLPPLAKPATNILQTSFTANWDSSATATGYAIYVIDSLQNIIVQPYREFNVGNVTSFNITGLNANTTYYYCLRAYNKPGNWSGVSNYVYVKTSAYPPIANAGPDQSVCQQATVILDGTLSSNTNGNALTYKWTVPAGISFSSATDAKPTFVAPNVSAKTDYPISLVVNNGSVDSQSDIVIVTVNPLPAAAGSISGPASVCKEQIAVVYTVPTIANATSYIWTLPVGATGTSTTNSITVSYGATAVSGNVTVKGRNTCGDGTASTFSVVVNSLPATAGTITGTATVCQGQSSVVYNVPAIANATSYIWTLPVGATGSSTTNSITVGYGVTAVSGNVTVKGSNTCGDGTASTFAITVNPLPVRAGTITGTASVCQGQNAVVYTVPTIANATSYFWSLPVGATGSSTTNSITVSYGTTAVSGNVTVKGRNTCGDGTASTFAVTVNPLPASPGTITGTATVCQGQSSVVYTVPTIANATSYIWTLPVGANGTSTTNSITVSYGTTAVSGNVTVKGRNTCGDGTASTFAVVVNPLPATAGTITGAATVCQGQSAVVYTVPTIANATSYIWTLPVGANGTSTTNSITVSYGVTAVSGNVTVKGRNTCGDGTASTFAVVVNPLPATAGTITGTATVCQSQSAVVYTVPTIANATSYIWTLPVGATGTSTTNSITVSYGLTAVSGNVTVKGRNTCGDGTASTLAVIVNVQPTAPIIGTITQPTCAVATGSVVLNGLPATGTWMLKKSPDTSGITITGTGTNASISGLAAGIYTFTVTNATGCTSPASDNVVINPQPVLPTIGTITGSSIVCQGQSEVIYSVSDIANANSYLWTLPMGAFGNSTTNSITVGYGASAVSGNVTVKGVNACGQGTASTLAVTVNLLPAGAGPITGNSSVCKGLSSEVYSVPTIPNATSYLWTLPTGATGFSTTNSITVNYGTSAVSGSIKVKGRNSCGDGAPSSLVVTVNSSCSSHFVPVWTGNGLDHMNINVYSAKLNGFELEAGDEIGIFDGSTCVGVGVLIGNLSTTSSIGIVVSHKEGTQNGYVAGNTISYKLYDSSINLEMANPTANYSSENPLWSTNGKFAIGASAFVALTGANFISQYIEMIAGWNIISANVIPGNQDLKNVFLTLINAGKLNKVMDETGKTMENFGTFGGWKNSIGNLMVTEGYMVNMLSPDKLSLTGNSVPLPLDIGLIAGWNIISYPYATMQDAKAMVQKLIDTGQLIKVMDESGKTIENFGAFGGWVNSIGNFVPGKGYKVNVTGNCILTFPSNATKALAIVPEIIPSTHFIKVFTGNGLDHMNINLVGLETSGLKVGDEIGIFDGSYCVGSATIGKDQLIAGIFNIPASSNENPAENINGFTTGHQVDLQLFRGDQSYKLDVVKVGGSDTFEKNGSLFVKVQANGLTSLRINHGENLFTVYPNPFTSQITIEVWNSERTDVDVAIYNELGQRIKNLFKGSNEGQLLLKWDGTNDSGHKVVPGIYLCRVNNETKKVFFKDGK